MLMVIEYNWLNEMDYIHVTQQYRMEEKGHYEPKQKGSIDPRQAQTRSSQYGYEECPK